MGHYGEEFSLSIGGTSPSAREEILSSLRDVWNGQNDLPPDSMLGKAASYTSRQMN